MFVAIGSRADAVTIILNTITLVFAVFFGLACMVPFYCICVSRQHTMNEIMNKRQTPVPPLVTQDRQVLDQILQRVSEPSKPTTLRRRQVPRVQETENEEEEKEHVLQDCCICLDARPAYMARPCNHLVFCETCVDELVGRGIHKCPLDNRKVDEFVRVWAP